VVKTLLICPQVCGRVEPVDEFMVGEVVPEVDESFCGLPRILEVASMNESPKGPWMIRKAASGKVQSDGMPLLGMKTWSGWIRVDFPNKGWVNGSQLGIDILEGPFGEGRTLVRGVVRIKGLVCWTSDTEYGSILGCIPMHCGPVRRRGHHGS